MKYVLLEFYSSYGAYVMSKPCTRYRAYQLRTSIGSHHNIFEKLNVFRFDRAVSVPQLIGREYLNQ
jgi:hypothetical protein